MYLKLVRTLLVFSFLSRLAGSARTPSILEFPKISTLLPQTRQPALEQDNESSNEGVFALHNISDPLLKKLELGHYVVVSGNTGQLLQSPAAPDTFHAAVRRERLRRSALSLLSLAGGGLGWHWPWDRRDVEPRPSNPNITFDLDSALETVKLASVAYCKPSNIVANNCSKCSELPGLEPVEAVFDEAWDLQAYSGWMASPLTGRREMVIGFRGTDSHSVYNWAENLHATKTDFQLPYPAAEGVRVHSGFFRSYNNSSLREHLIRSVKGMLEEDPDARLHVVGHSLGGAMASICALEMRLVLGVKDVRVTTFGSPRVGNAEFYRLFQGALPESRRFTHGHDIVPSVPVVYMGFNHVATEFFSIEVMYDKLLPKLQLVIVCDGTGEDPACHAGQCGYTSCTSVRDHLHYLNLRINGCD